MSGARRRDGPKPGRHAASKRSRRACRIVGGLLALVFLTGVWGHADRPSVLREAALAATEGPPGVEGELRVDDASDATALPSGFANEVMAAVGRDEVRVDERSRVVGFCIPETADAAFLLLAEELAGKGWSRIESGSAVCGSFSKEDGWYRWAFVSCVQMGDATSVVVQYATADEGS